MLIKPIPLLSIWIYILKILNIDDIIRIAYEFYIYNAYWLGEDGMLLKYHEVDPFVFEFQIIIRKTLRNFSKILR